MPPLPKRKRSKSRQGTIAAHHGITPPSRSRCPHCRHAALPHRVCPNCGFYKGRDILHLESQD